MNKELDEEILKWHKKTFPRATFFSQLEKFKEEKKELEKEKLGSEDWYMELADCYISIIGIRRFNQEVYHELMWNIISENEFYISNLEDFVKKKFEINKMRKWEYSKKGYKHYSGNFFERMKKYCLDNNLSYLEMFKKSKKEKMNLRDVCMRELKLEVKTKNKKQETKKINEKPRVWYGK